MTLQQLKKYIEEAIREWKNTQEYKNLIIRGGDENEGILIITNKILKKAGITLKEYEEFLNVDKIKKQELEEKEKQELEERLQELNAKIEEIDKKDFSVMAESIARKVLKDNPPLIKTEIIKEIEKPTYKTEVIERIIEKIDRIIALWEKKREPLQLLKDKYYNLKEQ